MNITIIVFGGAVGLIAWLLLPRGNRIPNFVSTSTAVRLNLSNKTWSLTKGTDSQAANLVFAEVAALLRAGVPAGPAWRRAAGVEVDSLGVPDQIGLTRVVGPAPARAMSAAAQLAVRLGAPLAQVLQTVDTALRTEEQTQADRQAALAGPQTTSRVLLGLPLLGLLLGWVLGANPVRVMLGGGFGSLSFLLGAVLLATGRWWISRLVAAAVGQTGDP